MFPPSSGSTTSPIPYLQVQQLVVVDVDAEGEVEASVPLVDDFEVMELRSGVGTSRKLVSLELLITIIR